MLDNGTVLPNRQRGAILLLSLIMLLLITIVGTGAMEVTTLDTKITVNVRDRQLAFQAAEAALLNAESVVDPADGAFPEANVTAGYVDAGLPNAWWQDGGVDEWPSGVPVADFQGQADLQYLIDEPEVREPDVMETVQDLGSTFVGAMFFYEVTSQGVGPGGATVMLQSSYARKKDLNN